MDQSIQSIKKIIADSTRVLIVQADNPDGDSMGSALALELILGELGKETLLYCAVDIPSYLRYMEGWDRVEKELPDQFDASIIVDTSTPTLFEKSIVNGSFKKISTKPLIVLDHHSSVEETIEFADVLINDSSSSSTGELVYKISNEIRWTIPTLAGQHIMTAILGDTQGLSNDLAKPTTYRVMAELMELGVDRPALEEKRRTHNKMPESIYRYKGRLIERSTIELDGKLALITIPQHEINEFSPLYNPGPLVQNDMLQIEGVQVAVVLKRYDDGKITGAIRANNGSPVAGHVAKELGGGGHPYAAGFKSIDNTPLDDIKRQLLQLAETALVQTEKKDEAL